MENKKIEFTHDQMVEVLSDIAAIGINFAEGLKKKKGQLCADLSLDIVKTLIVDTFGVDNQEDADRLQTELMDACDAKLLAKKQEKEALISMLPENIQEFLREAMADGAHVEVCAATLKPKAKDAESEDESDA